MEKRLLIVLPFLFVFPPLLLAVIMKIGIFSLAPGDVGNWISFWGSYLGSIIGVLGIFITTFIIIEKDKEENNDAITREVIKDAQKNIYNLYILEAIFLNEFVKYIEHFTSLFSNEYIDSEVYAMQSHHKNLLKEKEILLHSKINELKYSLHAIKYRGIHILDIEKFIKNKFTYIEYSIYLFDKYQSFSKKFISIKNSDHREREIQTIINANKSSESQTQKDIKQFEKNLNFIKKNNDDYLEYLNKILNSPTLDDKFSIEISKLAEK